MTPEEGAVIILTSLIRSGHRADTLEVLTRGDGRGTVPPGTLVAAVRALLETRND